MYTKEQIQQVREIDLLSYLRSREPGNLQHLGGDNYCTRDHDSLKISNGKWHWFSRHIGGRNALDYLMKVRGFSFWEAMNELGSYAGIVEYSYRPSAQTTKNAQPPGRIATQTEKRKTFASAPSAPAEKKLNLPELADGIPLVKPYLKKRGICQEVIDYCYDVGVLREDNQYHNCIFIGYDGDTPRFGAVRSIFTDLKRDLGGSDKRFSFRVGENENSTVLHVFEAAIDAMSFMTLCLQCTGERVWKTETTLSLSGVYESCNSSDIPPALKHYLETHPQTRVIALHLDNDEVGRGATKHIAEVLGDRYRVLDQPAGSGKDWNEHLQNEIRKTKQRKEGAR